MAYASVSQDGDTSPTLPRIPARPLSTEFDNVTGDVAVVDPTQTHSPNVSNLIKSITSSSPSYEILDDDDYEDLRTPRREEHEINNATSELPPVRTASVSRHLPLKYPIPDQSLQGVRNVERLEESAERLSTTSSIDEEVQRQKSIARRSSAASSHSYTWNGNLRKTSSNSMSNSIISVNNAARSGGYSPSAYITSPTGSIHSGSVAQPRRSRSSRLGNQVPEPGPLEMIRQPGPPTPPRTNGNSSGEYLDVPLDDLPEERPSSAASGDTFQQANIAFADFDGEHYQSRTSLDGNGSKRQQLALRRPPRARDSRMFREAQPGESMIYYPAPVPVMINLPTKLSTSNYKQQQQRRLQALSGMPEEVRKSAAWSKDEEPQLQDKRASQLPPQLRASAFFDHQAGVSPNLQLKDGSAVHTLDSILDAAAYAPVSAFTDHPIVGKLGNEVYGREKKPRKSAQIDVETKKKRRSSLSNILNIRKSSSNVEGGRVTSRESKVLDGDAGLSGDELEAAANRDIVPDTDELATPVDGNMPEDDDGSDGSDSDQEPGFSGAPTTLLAELQLRKTQQKQRNRTAADAFPNGMHSTLLEMDAVMQLQQRSRKQKHVTLAWEDHEAADKENYDDEDVPLGMLISEKDRANHFSTQRPVGLLERREIEDNEPLSHRRARLRGEPAPQPRTITPPQSDHGDEVIESKFKLNLPGMSDGQLEETEGETLAQRRARMKEEKEKVSAGNFASDVASHLGLAAISKEVPQSKTPDAEETLGQRRQRLKDEAAKKVKSSNSMADLLQRHPVGLRETPSQPHQFTRANTFGPSTVQARGSFIPSVPAHMATLPYYNHSPYINPSFGMSPTMMYGGMPQMSSPMAAMIPDPMGPPLTTQQRSVIDRWRQGIM